MAMEDRSSKRRDGFDLRSRSPDEIEEDVYAPYPAARSRGAETDALPRDEDRVIGREMEKFMALA